MSRHTDAPFAWGLPVSVAALATLVVGAPLVFYGLHLDHRPIVGPAAQRALATDPCPLAPALCPSGAGTAGQSALPTPFPGLGQAPGLRGVGAAGGGPARCGHAGAGRGHARRRRRRRRGDRRRQRRRRRGRGRHWR
jgi:hypothetical protein